MSSDGAFQEEMREFPEFQRALRAAVVTRPNPAIAESLIPRLASAARAAMIEAETQTLRGPAAARPPRRAWAARVGIVAVSIPFLFAGLAVAGVTVPKPARSAFDTVGITLPNQPANDSGDQAGTDAGTGAKAGSESNHDAEAKQKGNSEAAHKHAREQHQTAKGKATGHSKGKAVGLNGATPPGQAKQGGSSNGPPPHSNAGGNGGGNGGGSRPQGASGSAPHGNANGHSN